MAKSEGPVGVRDQEVADRNSHNLDLKRNVYQEVAVLGNLATGDLGCEVGSCQSCGEENHRAEGCLGTWERQECRDPLRNDRGK